MKPLSHFDERGACMTSAGLCKILGILLIVGTAVACMAYGAANMPTDPFEKAALKSKVRAVGTIPMLAGIGLLVYGYTKGKKRVSK
jgi:hypothetical protein